MLIPFVKPHSPINTGKKIQKVLDSGFIAEGKYVKQFEYKLSQYIGNKNCCLVNSGTAGIKLAYDMCELKKGDEVITTPLTCAATNLPLLDYNVNIKFADIQRSTGNICPDSIKRLITPKTKVIIAVDWSGTPCDYDEILKICKKNKIFLIEDAAHALGAKYNDTKVGNIADYTIFSFQAVKHMTTGDGGLITSKNKKNCEKLKLKRWFGISRDYKGHKWEQDIKFNSYKFHMNEIAGIIGLEQMKTIRKKIKSHIENGKTLDREISNPKISLLEKKNGVLSSYWVYSLLVDDKKKFQKYLLKYNIRSDELSFRNDTYTVFKKFKKDKLVNTRYFDKHMINIPCGWWLNNKDLEHIIETVNSY